MMEKWQKILILSPHTDDAELCMGGTIAKMRMAGKEMYHAAFSICRESVPVGLPRDTLLKEWTEANAAFGMGDESLSWYEYPVRHFPAHRQEILETMIMLAKTREPDVIFMPSSFDTHQDHEVIFQEGIRAFGKMPVSILGYEHAFISNSYRGFRPDLYSSLSGKHLRMKIEILSEYESQNFRPYFDPGMIASLARVRGKQAGTEFAEAFEVIRMVL